MFDAERVRALVAAVGGFYVRDRALAREQKKIVAALEAGTATDTDVRRYLLATKRYFTAFEREARGHLARVDRDLDKLYQVQYNLTAERGVAQRRVEATQGVLSSIEELAAE